MTYDPYAEPPASVEYQRQLEGIVGRIMGWFTPGRFVVLVLTAAIVEHVVRYGFPSSNGSESSSAGDAAVGLLEAITLADVAYWVGVYVALLGIVALHELCHWAAFRYFRVESYWALDWIEVFGRPILPTPGGLCWPRHDMAAYELSYWQDAVVSLAPLALSAVFFLAAGAWHVFVEPVAFWFWGPIILITTGPSPPDWLSLLNTPRARWELLVERVQAHEPHRAAEGYHV